MLRREEKKKVEYLESHVGFGRWRRVTHDVRWNRMKRVPSDPGGLLSGPTRGYTRRETDHMVTVTERGHELQRTEPVYVDAYRDRHWWLYRGEVYSTKEVLTSTDVQALIIAQEKRKRAKLERARKEAGL
ncbi:MAG: hypothetical protein WBQ41_15275 [Solirubrobacterales bacterium]